MRGLVLHPEGPTFTALPPAQLCVAPIQGCASLQVPLVCIFPDQVVMLGQLDSQSQGFLPSQSLARLTLPTPPPSHKTPLQSWASATGALQVSTCCVMSP